jgi:glycosyltransferase involved in cell wall biosynthesis
MERVLLSTNPLFISLGVSSVAWYRCALPANYLGWDWVGTAVGEIEPPGVMMGGNLAEEPDYDSYETIIVQQPHGDAWLKWIKERQANGQKIIYEVDDFIHGIHNIEDHRYKSHYGKKRRKLWQACMEQADGMICSTLYLADQYKKYNKNIAVAMNSIDTGRYDVEFPDRKDNIVIGWAGGTGHNQAVRDWLSEINNIIGLYKNVHFVTIGTPYSDLLAPWHPNQTLSIPWGTVENLPYMLTHFDIGLAPAHDSKYFLSKSDLRWLEASAVGVPLVVGRKNGSTPYIEVEDVKTGLIADTPSDAGDQIVELIEDKELRQDLAKNAYEYVTNWRDINEGCQQWANAVSTLTT